MRAPPVRTFGHRLLALLGEREQVVVHVGAGREDEDERRDARRVVVRRVEIERRRLGEELAELGRSEVLVQLQEQLRRGNGVRAGWGARGSVTSERHGSSLGVALGRAGRWRVDVRGHERGGVGHVAADKVLTFYARALERAVAEAAKEGLTTLKGHRSVGGYRASMYNALPLESVQTLAEVMQALESKG